MNTSVISADELREVAAFLDEYRPYLLSEAEQMGLLRAKLASSVVVPAAKLSPSIVTMYSIVRLEDLRQRETQSYTLVYPTHANASRRRISVLSPLGTAILGAAEGSIVEVPIPNGTVPFAVRAVTHQPHIDEHPRPVAGARLAGRPA